MLAPPGAGFGRELWLQRERPTEFAVVAIQIEARAQRGQHEVRELAKPVAEAPLVAGQRRITTSDRLEVFGGAAGHIEHASGWCAHLEGAALVILEVVAHVAHDIDGHAGHPGSFNEQPSRRRHNPDRSSNSSADCLGHVLRAEEFRSGGAVALPGVPRWIREGRDSNSRDVLVRGWRVAAFAIHPGEDAEMRRQPNRHQVGISEKAWVDDRMRNSGRHRKQPIDQPVLAGHERWMRGTRQPLTQADNMF